MAGRSLGLPDGEGSLRRATLEPASWPKAEPPCFRSQVVQEDSDEPEWVEAVLKVVLVDGWLQAHLYIYTSVATP